MEIVTCPRPDVLTAFVNGEIEENDAQGISKHAESCALCQDKIDKLFRQGDSVIQHLRQPPAINPEEAGQTVNKLMANAAQLVAPRTKHAPNFSSNVGLKPQSEAVSFNTFVEALKASGLMDKDEIYQFMLATKTRDTQQFALELVNQNKLTLYQAGLLARGKSKGLLLKNYEVLEKVGQGGMGMVFKARHRRMGRIVALKILPPSLMKSPNATKRFEREVQTAAKLSHENVVVSHDADDVEGVHFLVMEFVDGKDLSRIVKKQGPLSVSNAVDYILQAARGLAYAHENGIVHRDIKPQNLLVDSQGIVKVLDLGLARLDQDDDSELDEDGEPIDDNDLTKTGAVMGTVDYMAPEQAVNSKSSDGRSDIYSLGCTMFFLLNRRTVFGGSSVLDKLVAHREQTIPSLRELRSEVPPALEKVFQRMLAKHPDNRYQSMNDLIADLEPIVSGKEPPVVPPPVVSESSESLPDLADLEAAMQQSLASPLSMPPVPPPPISMQDTLPPSHTLVGSSYPMGQAPAPANSGSMNSGSISSPSMSTSTMSGPFNQPVRHTKPRRDYVATIIASTITGIVLLLLLVVLYGVVTGPSTSDLLPNGGSGRALIVMPDGEYDEGSYEAVRNALTSAEMTVETATPSGSSVKSKTGNSVYPNYKLTSVRPVNFDAIIFTNGEKYKEKESVDFLNELMIDCKQRNKPVYAMNAPCVLQHVKEAHGRLRACDNGNTIVHDIQNHYAYLDKMKKHAEQKKLHEEQKKKK